MLKNINLQLFADGDIEDTANLSTDVVETENVVKDGDQQPEIETTPEEQSINKDNPANHAFAEMRRKNKEYEAKLKAYEIKQAETDHYYAYLAAKKGRADIKTADEYFKAVKAEELAAQYQETQDPVKLAQLIKEMIMPELKPVQQQETFNSEAVLNKEVEEFNKEFKGTLKSFDDIPTLPNSEKIIEKMVNNGLSLNEAYRLANPDKIIAATKQAAINQAKGLTHVKANNNGGNVDTVQVTAGEISEWKRWFPGKTDDQCRKEIAANKKHFE
jgi:hypothetical protein